METTVQARDEGCRESCIVGGALRSGEALRVAIFTTGPAMRDHGTCPEAAKFIRRL